MHLIPNYNCIVFKIVLNRYFVQMMLLTVDFLNKYLILLIMVDWIAKSVTRTANFYIIWKKRTNLRKIIWKCAVIRRMVFMCFLSWPANSCLRTFLLERSGWEKQQSTAWWKYLAWPVSPKNWLQNVNGHSQKHVFDADFTVRLDK